MNRHNQSSQIQQLMFPEIKQKLAKDYHRDNMEKMKMKEKQIQSKIEEERNQPKKDPWKMKRFQSVDSKVQQQMKETNKNNQPIEKPQPKPIQKQKSIKQLREEKENTLKQPINSQKALKYEANYNYEINMKPKQVEENIFNLNQQPEIQMEQVKKQPKKRISEQEIQQEVKKQQKDLVPKASEINKLMPRNNKNYVNQNRNKMIYEAQTNKLNDQKEDKKLHKNYGKIPNYINKFRNEKEEENQKMRQMEEDAKMPPGTRLMGEDERIKTLEELNLSKKEINNMLERMPIANKSLMMEKKKKELEDKLLRIERAIETFSKKTVYVCLE